MSTTPKLQIRTVYSERDIPASDGPSGRLIAIALLTIAVSAAWLYVTWKPVWGWIEHEVMIGEVILTTMGPQAQPLSSSDDETDEKDKKVENDDVVVKADKATRAEKAAKRRELAAQQKQAQARLVATTAGWLGFATFTGLWLTMAGAAGLLRGSRVRFVGWLLAVLILVCTGVLVWYVNREYGWLESILPKWVRPAIAGLGFSFALMLGAALNRRGIGLLRIGGVLVVLSAVLSVGALWATLRWGGIPSDKLATMNYAKVFAIQSAYGWVLLLGTLRLRS